MTLGLYHDLPVLVKRVTTPTLGYPLVAVLLSFRLQTNTERDQVILRCEEQHITTPTRSYNKRIADLHVMAVLSFIDLVGPGLRQRPSGR